jgi:hypothetical protein
VADSTLAPAPIIDGAWSPAWVNWFQKLYDWIGGAGWRSCVPVVTGAGSMTVASLTINGACYLRQGTTVQFAYQLVFTLGGTAANQISVTVPLFVNGAVNCAVTAYVFQSALGTWKPASFAFAQLNTNQIQIFPDFPNNFNLGSTTLMVSGSYRI